MTTKRIILSALVFFSLTSACVDVPLGSENEVGDTMGEETGDEIGDEIGDTAEPDDWYFSGCCHCEGQTAECDPWSSSAENLCFESGDLYGATTWLDPYCVEDSEGNPVCLWSQLICEANIPDPDPIEECGNGVVDQGEMCDGQNTEYTCTNLGLFDAEPGQSVVTCGDDCFVDVSECEVGQEEACCFCGENGKTCFPLDNWEDCPLWGEANMEATFWSDGCKVVGDVAECPGWSNLECDPMAK